MKVAKRLKGAFWVLWKAMRLALGSDYYHLPQPKGKFMARNAVRGYYNDLRLKADWPGERDEEGIPVSRTSTGKRLYFPTTLTQYGLGHYDKWLETRDETHRREFMKIAQWLAEHQDEQGGWDAFGQIDINAVHPYSAMVQGQAVSLLLRAYQETNNVQYREASVKALDLMLKPVEEGGTARYRDGELFLEEVVQESQNPVLNGWIFAIFGIWDYVLLIPTSRAREVLTETLSTLAKYLDRYDRGYWSNYDWQGSIASPFYHTLHIALLEALYELSGEEIFGKTARQWVTYQKSLLNRSRAALQKLWEKALAPQEVVSG